MKSDGRIVMTSGTRTVYQTAKRSQKPAFIDTTKRTPLILRHVRVNAFGPGVDAADNVCRKLQRRLVRLGFDLLVLWHVRINPLSPRIDSTGHILHFRVALGLEEVDGAGAAATHLAVNGQQFVLGQFL